MQIDVGNLFVVGSVQTLISTFFWLVVRKTVEKVDEVQKQLAELKDKRVAVIESELREHRKDNDERFAAAAASRKELHVGLAKVREQYVEKTFCGTAMAQFSGAVLDLARVEEKIGSAVQWVAKLQDQQIAQGQDLARMQGAQGGPK